MGVQHVCPITTQTKETTLFLTCVLLLGLACLIGLVAVLFAIKKSLSFEDTKQD